MSFSHDYNWSLRFLPAVREIVGPRLLVQATLEQDILEATDMLVLSARGLRIAVRIRRRSYTAKYAHEFTIRASRHHGAPSELEKILEGFGDWLFYAFESEDGKGLTPWSIIDLASFREHHAKGMIGKRQRNREGESTFDCFAFVDYQSEPQILVDASWLEPAPQPEPITLQMPDFRR